MKAFDLTKIEPLTQEEMAYAGSNEPIDDDRGARIAEARRIVLDCTRIIGSAASRYLESRKIDCTLLPRGTVGWHDAMKAMVVIARDGMGDVVACQRLYFDRSGKPELDEKGKKKRLSKGPIRGAALTLNGTNGAAEVLICEGAEDALSLWIATRAHVRGALGAGMMGAVPLPAGVPAVIVADNDDAGKAAAMKAAQALLNRGHSVKIATPTDVKDSNDLLVKGGVDAVRELVASAVPFDDADIEKQETRPRILVDAVNPDVTVEHLRDIFATSGEFYDRGIPVRVIYDESQGGTISLKMDADAIVLTAHKMARPYSIRIQKDGSKVDADARLPKSIAAMYLSDRGEWKLPVLNGIASAPLLRDDGTIRSAKGYDAASGFWLENVPDVDAIIPGKPSKEDAEKALAHIRKAFSTFCFADAQTVEGDGGIATVDIGQHPGMDESAFLNVLMTAVCRPSLPVAPGALFTAAETSGAGTGKGKLARCISAIAFGRQPSAVTAGSGIEELEKRLSAKLIESAPAILIDNVNGAALKSDLLASAISERPAEIRILGRTEMARLNASAFIAITGNGLRVSEDLARRFIDVRFDAKTEDPEARPFRGDIVADMTSRREELLAACLTIWRWGRQTKLEHGRALGGFNEWTRWVRDPLLALGCLDPVERVAEAKANDPRRQKTAEIFKAWWIAHGGDAVQVKDIDQSVLAIVDPQNRGRQYVAAAVAKLEGTRLASFLMTRQEAPGTWGVSTYALQKSASELHRGHRGHRPETAPMPPMPPMGHGERDSDPPANPDPMPPMPPMPTAQPKFSDEDWTETTI